MVIPFGYCQCGCGQQTTISKHTSNRFGRVKDQPTRYISGHGPQPPTTDYSVDEATDCWPWRRYTDRYGMPRFVKTINGTVSARLVYFERSNGPVPANCEVVQTCNNRLCINPSHLVVRTATESFWLRVDKHAPNGCWEWQSTMNDRGYGVLRFQGLKGMAHRVAFELTNGPIPDGLCLLHRCDNPRCVNPAHLFLGTKGDNARDMVQKQRSLIGERNHKAKITREQATEISRLYATGKYPQQRIAAQFGIGQGQVSKIVRRTEWHNLP